MPAPEPTSQPEPAVAVAPPIEPSAEPEPAPTTPLKAVEPKVAPKLPKKPHTTNDIEVAIIATVVIVLGLAALAVYAFLRTK
jgi:hypothetical protein